MKKLLGGVLAFLILFSFCACEKTSQPLRENLLENPGFESETGDTVTGWTLERYDATAPADDCGAIALSGAPEGKNVLRIDSPEYNDTRFIQKVSVSPNAYYCFSARVKVEQAEPREAQSGANLSLIQTYCVSDFALASDRWQTITLYGKTESDTKEATLALRLGYYSADCRGTVYFDDVSFARVEKNEIPADASILSMAPFTFESGKEETGAQSVSGIEAGVLVRTAVYYLLLALAAFFLFKRKISSKLFYALLALALVIRLAASVLYTGFHVDINCFASWGARMVSEGPFAFYSEDYFCDYPPLYMLVLGLLSLLSGGASLASGFGLLLLKLPAVLADIAGAILIRRIADRHKNALAAPLALLYAFLPAAILNSAVWGQVDSILVLFMLLTFYLVDSDRFALSVPVFFVGLLLKPQAILFGPVLLLAAAREFTVIAQAFSRKQAKVAKTRLVKGFGALFASCAGFFLISLVLRNGQSPLWLLGKYSEAYGSYNYGTLNSFGLMGLLGGQWVNAESASILGLSYSALGTILLVCVLAGAVALYVLAAVRQKGLPETSFFFLLTSFVLAGVVCVSTRTHERYLFPAIAFLILSFASCRDKRMLYLAFGFALLNFLNTALVLYIYETLGVYMKANDPVFLAGSLAVTALFVFLTVVTAQTALGRKNPKTLMKEPHTAVKTAQTSRREDKLGALLDRRKFRLPRVGWKDIVICLVITAIYAGVAFYDLGDTSAPQTLWQTDRAYASVTADLGKDARVDAIMLNLDSAGGTVSVSYSSDGEQFTDYTAKSLLSEDIDRWQTLPGEGFTARFVRLSVSSAVSIHEAAFMQNGEVLPVVSLSQTVSPIDAQADPAALFDCPESLNDSFEATVPQTVWQNGKTAEIRFEEPFEPGEIAGVIPYAEPGAEMTIEFLHPDGTWVRSAVFSYDMPTDSWTSAYFLYDEEVPNKTSAVRVSGGDGAIRLSELVFVQADGTPAKIASVVPQSEDCDISACFDEQETFLAARAAALRFDETADWTVTSVADYVIADFGKTVTIQRGTFYPSVCTGDFSVYYSYDGVSWSEPETHSVKAGDLYYWRGLPSDGGSYASLSARYVAVCASSRALRLLECGFFESENAKETIPVVSVITGSTDEYGGANLFDEQTLVATRPSFRNSMYFDEIYHARTAYESANGLSIYEWTHPPLGKDMISWCVSLMGMTPFAWRFAGTMAGVLMLPVLYFLGLLLFRKTSWASALTILMALDGMHFVQTRIATIDSFGVLWILVMFLFMYWYYSISFYDKPLHKTFLPLGLCGVAFGLGAASKWICLYAGAGLAVLFFITVFRRFAEYRVAKANVETATGETKTYLQHICDTFVPSTAKTILFCLAFFIVIPLGIYCLSYYPYWNASGESRAWYQIILDNQSAMFNYHSKLVATHPYQSDWFTWPVIYRPMYFYSARQLSGDLMGCISCFGNPVIWYMGLVSALGCAVLFVRRLFKGTPVLGAHASKGWLSLFSSGDSDLSDRGERDTRTLLFLLLGLAANLLPWIGVSRCVFIYHYFASVPFIMMMTVFLLRYICRKKPRTGAILTIALLALALALFILFKPVWSGTEVSRDYVNTYLKWFSSWEFGSGRQSGIVDGSAFITWLRDLFRAG